MKSNPNIINIDVERSKRLSPSTNAIKLLNMLEDVLEGVPAENYPFILKEFIGGMDLGEQPVTALATVCAENPEAFQILSIFLGDISKEVLASLLEYVGKMYPKDFQAIHRLKVILTTFHTRNLSMEKLERLFLNADMLLVDYLLGSSNAFEKYALMSNSNIIPFPKGSRTLKRAP